MLAWYFQKFEGRIGWKDFVLAAVLIAVPVYLIKRQPDLGTSLLIAASGFYVLYFAGLSWKVIAGLVAAAGAAAPLIWPHLRDYQRERILTFIDPTRDPLGAGLSLVAGVDRTGFGRRGRQRLVERHADAPRFSAGAAHRFHLRRVRRGIRPDRQCGAARPLPLLIGRGLMITAGASTLFARLIAGAIDADVLHLCVREHGHGERRAAGGRRAAAARVLRRHRARFRSSSGSAS